MAPVGYFDTIQIAALVLAIISILATPEYLLFPVVKRDPRLKIGLGGGVEEGSARLEKLGLSKEQAKTLSSALKGRLDQSLIATLGDGVDRQHFFAVLEQIRTSQDAGGG